MDVLCTPAAMQTLINAFAQYLTTERQRSTRTITRYVAVVEKFAGFLADEPATVGLPLADVSRALVLAFLNLEGAQSPSVWNLQLAALRALYEYLRTARLVRGNPTKAIGRRRQAPDERVPLSMDEYLALVDALERAPALYRSRNVALVQVLFHCLLRVSELVSLDLSQVDFGRREFLSVLTKGGKRRSLPFNDLVAEALERYLAERWRFRPTPEVGALFLSDRGARLSVRTVEQMVKTYAARAGVSAFPHLQRHSGATELADLGTATHDVQQLLGHESLRTTEIYLHSGARSRRRAVDKLGAAVAARLARRRRGGGNAAAGRCPSDCV